MDPKYNLAIKLVAVGIAVGIAAYFGMDISSWVSNMLATTTPAPLPTP